VKIPVIDIFAGPGGLGEGFSSVIKRNRRAFDVRLSIEMDTNAHNTLELRSFFRKFPIGEAPPEYYSMLRETNLSRREELKILLYEKYADQAKEAQEEAWCTTLGVVPENEVDRKIKAELKGRKDWVLIGGPPCQAYSLVGRSRRQWKENLDNKDPRVHLYKEYLRIIAKHDPAVFVMENVKGLLSSKVDGVKIFDLIKRDLRDPSTVFPESQHKYRIYSLTTEPADFKDGQPVYDSDSDYLIKSEEYGVPQKRHRVILLGIRADIKNQPDTLKLADEPVTLSDVIGDLPKIRSGINRSYKESRIVNGKKKRVYIYEVDSDKHWSNLINTFQKEVISWNGFAKNYPSKDATYPVKGKGAEFVKCNTPSKDNPLYGWYYDPNLKGVANHESRSHLVQDLKRYLFSSMYAKTYKSFPLLPEYEKYSSELLPDHKNAKSGIFVDRFRVQLPDQPATTVTSHISKDGHYFIHYDYEQCRSLTVREAARIQTFPDNYLFCGSRTAQYHQVGNAVPPLLANKIARIVYRLFEKVEKG